jgi:hypothetical protein
METENQNKNLEKNNEIQEKKIDIINDTINAFVRFFKDFVKDERCKYKDIISSLQNKALFEVDLSDLMSYDESYYQYVVEYPSESLFFILDAIRDIYRLYNQIDPIDDFESIYITFCLPENWEIISDIEHRYSNLSFIKGTIISISTPKNRYRNICFRCDVCNTECELEQDIETDILKRPSKCGNPRCNEKGKKNFKIISTKSTSEIIQLGYIKVENIEDIHAPIKFLLPNRFVNLFEIGDYVTIIGVLMNESESNDENRNVFHPILISNNINKIEMEKEKKHIISYIMGEHIGENYQLRKNGIYRVKEIMNKNQVTTEIIETPIWTWNHLNITHVFGSNIVDEKRYTIEINDEIYERITFKEFEHKIKSQYTGNLKRDSLSIFFQKYISYLNINEMKFKNICGYTEEGFILPNEYSIDYPGDFIKENCLEILKMAELKEDPVEVKQIMKDLYNLIDLEYKGIMFAMGVVMPFTHALLPITKLMPWMSFTGSEASSGKSDMAKLITKKFWNSLPDDSELLNVENIESDSRFLEIEASHTFPIGIDDCQKLTDKCLSVMKSKTTNKQSFTRKNEYGKVAVKKPLSTPEVFTQNKPSILFDDPQYLTRGINIPVRTPKNRQESNKDNFSKTTKKIKNGMFGKIVIDTYNDKIKTFDNLTALYFKMPLIDAKSEVRKNQLFRLVNLGAEIFKMAFDFELNLEGLKYLIDETLSMGSEQMLQYIHEQITAKWYSTEYEKNQCKVSWVRNPVYAKAGYKNAQNSINQEKYIEWYYYRTCNLSDLINVLKLNPKDWSLSQLSTIIQTRISNVEEDRVWMTENQAFEPYMIFFDKQIQSRCIKIPGDKIDFLLKYSKIQNDLFIYIRKNKSLEIVKNMNFEQLKDSDDEFISDLELEFSINRSDIIKALIEIRKIF